MHTFTLSTGEGEAGRSLDEFIDSLVYRAEFQDSQGSQRNLGWGHHNVKEGSSFRKVENSWFRDMKYTGVYSVWDTAVRFSREDS